MAECMRIWYILIEACTCGSGGNFYNNESLIYERSAQGAQCTQANDIDFSWRTNRLTLSVWPNTDVYDVSFSRDQAIILIVRDLQFLNSWSTVSQLLKHA